MDALVSGQAALAIFLDHEEAGSIHTRLWRLDQEGEPTPIKYSERHRLLDHCTDVQILYETSFDRAVIELEKLYSKDRALHLTIIALDGNGSIEIQLEALELMEELFSSLEVMDSVAWHFYSNVMPENNNFTLCLANAKHKGYRCAEKFLSELILHQQDIKDGCKAWDDIPVTLFASEEDKARFRRILVAQGAFYSLIAESNNSGIALLQLYTNKNVIGLRNSRTIIQEWVKPFSESIVRKPLGLPEEIEQDLEDRVRNVAYHTDSLNGYGRKQNVDKQKFKIKELIQAGDEERAVAYTQALVDSQRHSGKPEHIAKSLCDLAMHAKNFQNYELQLKFAKWAVNEVSTDAWSQAQLGDAYRIAGSYPEAVKHYQIAMALGEERVALNGKAETFKDSGDLTSAIEVFGQCTTQFPNDVVGYNGYASALASFGRIEESLEKYDEALRFFPFDTVTLCGKATVLREAGRHQEALDLLKDLLENPSGSTVAKNIEATIYRQLGDYKKSEDCYKAIIKKDKYDLYAGNGLASLYKEYYHLGLANKEFLRVAELFLRDVTCRMGIAGIYKLNGDYANSLTEYDKILKFAPRSNYARNGKAALLVVQGKLREAFTMLPTYPPSSQTDWVSYHIRCMGLIKDGRLDDATANLRYGLSNCPWFQERQFFRTSLAAILNRRREFTESITLLKEEVQPALEPIRNIILLHSYVLSNDAELAEKAYRSVSGHRNNTISGLGRKVYSMTESKSLLSIPSIDAQASIETFNLLTNLAA